MDETQEEKITGQSQKEATKPLAKLTTTEEDTFITNGNVAKENREQYNEHDAESKNIFGKTLVGKNATPSRHTIKIHFQDPLTNFNDIYSIRQTLDSRAHLFNLYEYYRIASFEIAIQYPGNWLDPNRKGGMFIGYSQDPSRDVCPSASELKKGSNLRFQYSHFQRAGDKSYTKLPVVNNILYCKPGDNERLSECGFLHLHQVSGTTIVDKTVMVYGTIIAEIDFFVATEWKGNSSLVEHYVPETVPAIPDCEIIYDNTSAKLKVRSKNFGEFGYKHGLFKEKPIYSFSIKLANEDFPNYRYTGSSSRFDVEDEYIYIDVSDILILNPDTTQTEIMEPIFEGVTDAVLYYEPINDIYSQLVRKEKLTIVN